jgi:hypothetical protein
VPFHYAAGDYKKDLLGFEDSKRPENKRRAA